MHTHNYENKNFMIKLKQEFINHPELAGAHGYCNPTFAVKIADWWIEHIKEKITTLKTDERKVSIFGKGMDSWEARSYDEKQLVNAVIKDIINLISKE
jgi:hypothetical protein